MSDSGPDTAKSKQHRFMNSLMEQLTDHLMTTKGNKSKSLDLKRASASDDDNETG